VEQFCELESKVSPIVQPISDLVTFIPVNGLIPKRINGVIQGLVLRPIIGYAGPIDPFDPRLCRHGVSRRTMIQR